MAISNIREYLSSEGYTLLSNDSKEDMDFWRRWWKGEDEDFHKYKVYNGKRYVKRTRAEMNAAKIGCEYWANLLWNQDCYITVDSKAEDKTENNIISISKRLVKFLKRDNNNNSQRFINQVFEKNNFYSQFNDLCEKYLAVGKGAIVVHDTDIEFVEYDNIEILGYKNGIVNSAAFTSYFTHHIFGNCIYLTTHLKQDDDTYLIKNKFFKVLENNTLEEFSKEEFRKMNIKEEVTRNTKHFFILKPNISNNKHINSPDGISVYANSIDILKMIDLALDGIKASMEIGRPRIAVSAQGIHTVISEKDGKAVQVPAFDTSDITFYQLPEGIEEKKIIEDMTTQYRAGDFEASLEKALSLFSMSIGLGQNVFKWENGQIKTATEVISENSTMFRTMRKHQQIIKDCMIAICKAILEDNGKDYDLKIGVEFDDSIIIDRESERVRGQQLYRDGVIPKWLYLVDYEGYTEVEAKKIVEEAKKESAQSEGSISDFFNNKEGVI